MDPTTRAPQSGEADPLAVRPEDRPAAAAEEDSGWGRTPAYQLAGPLRYVALVENAVIFALLAAIVLVILAQVAFRRFLDDPLSWSTEIATQLLVYVAFLGFAIGVRDNAHVAMRLFEHRLGARARRATRVTEILVLGAVVAAIGYGGLVYTIEQADVVTPAGFPLWTAFAALPFGCAFGVLHAVVELVAVLRGRADDPDDTPEAAA
jgi:TRAP-type C4-dicarboxylate transport system permease small subunit